MSSVRRSWTLSWAFRSLVVVLRLVLVAIALQMSGAAQAADFIVDACSDDADCCSDCPLEVAGHTCPPGCPNCHCHHGGIALTPTPGTEADIAAIPRDHRNVVRRPHKTETPQEPFRASVYRPPRAGARLI